MPIRMSKLEVELAAISCYEARMGNVGVSNAKRILHGAWKLAQAEDKRQKEENRKCTHVVKG